MTKYKEGGEQYDVWLRADLREPRPAGGGRRRSRCPTPNGQAGRAADARDRSSPNAARRRSSATTASGRSASSATSRRAWRSATRCRRCEAFVKTLDLPPEYRYEFLGEAKLMAESNSNFALAFLLAFIFMYMILAAQFESFVHPITILLAVPLTLPFALLSLILLRHAAGRLRDDRPVHAVRHREEERHPAGGLHERAAGKQGCRERGDPEGERGAPPADPDDDDHAGGGDDPDRDRPRARRGARASMAKVILGGQLLSLLLSLLVTPVAYSLWDDLTLKVKKVPAWFRRRREHIAVQETKLEVPTIAATHLNGGALSAAGGECILPGLMLPRPDVVTSSPVRARPDIWSPRCRGPC